MKIKILVISLICFSSLYGSDSLFQKGIYELAQGNLKNAQKEFLESAIVQPSFSSFYNLGIASGNLKDWNKAKWAFESALKYNPLNNNAIYNAQFATKKLNKNIEWTHPFSWLERIIINFGALTWQLLAVVFSILSGVFIFFMISKSNHNSSLRKWSFRLLLPSVLLSVIGSFGIYKLNNHFTEFRFAILKDGHPQFYISPEGVEIDQNTTPGSRLKIIRHDKDENWFQVEPESKNLLWVEKKDVYLY